MIALMLLTAAAPPVANGPLRLCDGIAGPCREIEPTAFRIGDGEVHAAREVTVDPRAMPMSRPLVVWITALASSEVRWNGVVIGHNGDPGPDRASETPGHYIYSVAVPVELVRPGANQLSVKMSAHHLWLPVRHPLHRFEVTPYETPTLPDLDLYLPALLTIGALAVAFVYFSAAAVIDRSNRDAWLVAGIAGSAIVQLVIEVGRVFVAYLYPWHLARVSAIALLAAATAVLAAAYAARRFAPAWRRAAPAAATAASLAALLLVPSFDLKAVAAILVGLVAVAACALRGIGQDRGGARAALAGAALLVGAMIWQRSVFLDQAYFLGIAALLVTLVAEQVVILRRTRHRRDAEARRVAALEERLRRAGDAGETIVELRNGSRIDRVAEGDIVYVRAADDYCDVVLADGRVLLVTANLRRLLEKLPAAFVRVHKSFAVNPAHVAKVTPRAGGGRQLLLSQGPAIPVGRRYADSLAGLAPGG
jgi:DNA-binding LytR/AlgR family response regulator